ncbi:MAG TPA: GDSL-type esterase/lipase family protein [Ktedonobacteraceae bacterium]|nr:GDSL-type esterase/lipase family protein [Ktedonobacteraceae bacterium]
MRLLALLGLCALTLSSCVQTSDPTSTNGTQAHTSSSTLLYVALGASDTFGIGTQNPYTENWASDLSVLLGSRTRLVNLGVPSMTLHQALTAELPIALEARPGLVTIWLAVNDLATNVPVNSYRHDLDTMLSRLQKAAPHARIEVGNVPDLTSVPFFRSSNQLTLRQHIATYNTAIASVVLHHHAILVDLSAQGYNLRAFPEYISRDGLHPSASGYLRLAELFYDALPTK